MNKAGSQGSSAVARGSGSRVDCLDGLRGLAAVWVFVGHTLQLAGWRIPLLASPGYGVDLFIMISGFLMAFHYIERRSRERWEAPSTCLTFWIRRFFRIAPLYYAALAVAIAIGPWLGEARIEIASVTPETMTKMERYTDQSLTNVFMHVSFLFGAFPDYGFRTPLPDWSIGLEMQYYLAFPIIMIIIGRLGWVLSSLAFTAACFIIFNMDPEFFEEFEMPSILVLRLQIFLAGMLCAAALRQARRTLLLFAMVAIALVAVPIDGDISIRATVVRIALALLMFGLIHHQQLSDLPAKALKPLAAALGSRPFHFLGEMSYGIYLIHLMILLPVMALVATTFGASTPAPVRFAMAFGLAAPIVAALAYIAYRTIETPGRAMGRRLLASGLAQRLAARPVG